MHTHKVKKKLANRRQESAASMCGGWGPSLGTHVAGKRAQPVCVVWWVGPITRHTRTYLIVENSDSVHKELSYHCCVINGVLDKYSMFQYTIHIQHYTICAMYISKYTDGLLFNHSNTCRIWGPKL